MFQIKLERRRLKHGSGRATRWFRYFTFAMWVDIALLYCRVI